MRDDWIDVVLRTDISDGAKVTFLVMLYLHQEGFDLGHTLVLEHTTISRATYYRHVAELVKSEMICVRYENGFTLGKSYQGLPRAGAGAGAGAQARACTKPNTDLYNDPIIYNRSCSMNGEGAYVQKFNEIADQVYKGSVKNDTCSAKFDTRTARNDTDDASSAASRPCSPSLALGTTISQSESSEDVCPRDHRISPPGKMTYAELEEHACLLAGKAKQIRRIHMDRAWELAKGLSFDQLGPLAIMGKFRWRYARHARVEHVFTKNEKPHNIYRQIQLYIDEFGQEIVSKAVDLFFDSPRIRKWCSIRFGSFVHPTVFRVHLIDAFACQNALAEAEAREAGSWGDSHGRKRITAYPEAQSGIWNTKKVRGGSGST